MRASDPLAKCRHFFRSSFYKLFSGFFTFSIFLHPHIFIIASSNDITEQDVEAGCIIKSQVMKTNNYIVLSEKIIVKKSWCQLILSNGIIRMNKMTLMKVFFLKRWRNLKYHWFLSPSFVIQKLKFVLHDLVVYSIIISRKSLNNSLILLRKSWYENDRDKHLSLFCEE